MVQVRAGAADLKNRVKSVLAGSVILAGSRHRQCEQGRLGAVGASLRADVHDGLDRALGIKSQTLCDRTVIALQQIRCGGVVGSALGAEHEKAGEPVPVVDLPDITTRAVEHLTLVGDRSLNGELAGATCGTGVKLCNVHPCHCIQQLRLTTAFGIFTLGRCWSA